MALAIRVLRLLPARFADLGERLVHSFVDGLAILRQGHALAAVLGLSLLAWLAEATMYYVIMLGFPFPARPEAALLGASAANFGAMIPSSPGYLGTFDLPLPESCSPRCSTCRWPRPPATRWSSTPRSCAVGCSRPVLHLATPRRSYATARRRRRAAACLADLAALTHRQPAAAPTARARRGPVGARSSAER